MKVALKKVGQRAEEVVYTDTKNLFKSCFEDRTLFSQVLSRRTANIKDGDTEIIEICGINRVYVFWADGYMHGFMLKAKDIHQNTTTARKEYRNEIDTNPEIANIWTDSLPSGRGNAGDDFSSAGYGGGTTSNDSFLESQPQRNKAGDSERDGQNYKTDHEELKEIVRKLEIISKIQ